ncbi:hypothetical protein [Saccharospirillum sp.]|uniref:hypothetical protein n=1 Tax=Saccharospirillum sp. TaxID=2033801 RepID=UPI0034A027F1
MIIFSETTKFLETCFVELERLAPRPTFVYRAGGKSLRYLGKEIEAALIQKFARMISSLNGALLLIENGYTQETNVLFRTLDEIFEDILFLAQPCVGGELSKLHQGYLDIHFAEEFENEDSAFLSSQNRPTIPRRKIHAALANANKNSLNPSDAKQNNRTISQAYSGYVHGSSVHLIEMIYGLPPRYYLHGQIGTKWHEVTTKDFINYGYRGILACLISAKALGSQQVVDRTIEFRSYYENQTGDTGQGDPNELLRKMKSPNKTL